MAKQIASTELKLKDFPPFLRKLGQYMLENDDIRSFKQGCEDLGLNYDTYRSVASDQRRKHNRDLNLWLDTQRMLPIRRNSYFVYQDLADKAISGTAKEKELFIKLRGDLIEKHQLDHNITGLFAVFSGSPSTIPQDYQEKRAAIKPDNIQVVDVELED